MVVACYDYFVGLLLTVLIGVVIRPFCLLGVLLVFVRFGCGFCL